SGLPFEEGREALADPDAHRRDAVAAAAALELAQQGPGDARPRCADRMTDGNRAAVRVGAVVGQTKRANARDHLRRESLVQLDRVALLRRNAGPLHELAHGGDRTESHVVRMYARRGARHHAPERTESERLRLLARRDEERGRAVVDAGRVACRPGAAILERGLELSELLDVRIGARVLVLAHELFAVVHGLDLAGEETVRFGARVAILAPRRVAVLLGATDVLLHGDVLGRLAERDRVITQIAHPRIHQAPPEGGVGEHALAARKSLGRFQRDERRARHALDAAGDDNVGLTGADTSRGVVDRLEPAAAEAI